MKTIKSIFKIGAVVSIIAALTGCVFVPVCNPQGGYSQGVIDGQNRFPENFNYAATCPNNRWRINRAYRRGYRHGLNMPQPIAPIAIVSTPVVQPVRPHWRPRPVPVPVPVPWHPHDHHHHPRPNPRPGPRPHPHHHRFIPGVPTPTVTTSVSHSGGTTTVSKVVS